MFSLIAISISLGSDSMSLPGDSESFSSISSEHLIAASYPGVSLSVFVAYFWYSYSCYAGSFWLFLDTGTSSLSLISCSRALIIGSSWLFSFEPGGYMCIVHPLLRSYSLMISTYRCGFFASGTIRLPSEDKKARLSWIARIILSSGYLVSGLAKGARRSLGFLIYQSSGISRGN